MGLVGRAGSSGLGKSVWFGRQGEGEDLARVTCLMGLTSRPSLSKVAGIASFNGFYGLRGVPVMASLTGLAGRQRSTDLEKFKPNMIANSYNPIKRRIWQMW